MPLDTLRQIALAKSQKQPKQIDQLTEETPFLDVFKFGPATHELWHNAEALTSADAMGFVAMDAPLPSVNAKTKLIRFDLAKMGGMMEVPEDRARVLGGKEAYFAQRQGPVLRVTGMSIEKTLLYDNARQYAIDHCPAFATNVYNAGGTGAVNFSIIAIRFEEGICQGLYNPKGFGSGTLFDTEPLNGGSLYKINSDGVLGYGVRFKNDLGFMLTGTRNVGAIVNIDISAGKVPSAQDIDNMLGDIRATESGSTYLVMHRRVRSWLSDKFKTDRVQLQPTATDINRTIKTWDGIPIITTYQMLDRSEPLVTTAMLGTAA